MPNSQMHQSCQCLGGAAIIYSCLSRTDYLDTCHGALLDRSPSEAFPKCPLWVISGHFAVQSLCPLYPPKTEYYRSDRTGRKIASKISHSVFLGSNDNLILKHVNKEPPGCHRLGPKRFRCIRSRPMCRTHFHVGAGTARAPVVLDNHRTRISTDDTQPWLFSDARASDARFQSAMAHGRIREQFSLDLKQFHRCRRSFFLTAGRYVGAVI
jgi:hypothetical protein